MAGYGEVFSGRHVVLPVIHVDSVEQTLRNARLAREAGADGVFLINHGTPWTEVLRIHREVAGALPDWWIGVNCLGLPGDEVFAQLSAAVAGVWIDDARIEEETEEQPEAERIAAARRASEWAGLYFGGVAFKYQRPVTDYARVARLAARYADVVMTSGPGTGQAADRAKIAAMKAALGEVPLAVASGITPENVGEYLDVADCILVATGISASFTELDAERVAALLEVVRGWGRT